ncbi:hypothetical protein, partial [Pseudomonas syringae]|uniref:hypothetical protein n=1 Tax=Pseudomonas syringae TaxID=317 RepID=UPI001F3C3E94
MNAEEPYFSILVRSNIWALINASCCCRLFLWVANAPIQVILNADGYRKDRETKRPNSAGTDFFEGESGAFATHKKSLQQQLA